VRTKEETLVLLKGRKGFHWRLVAANNRIIAIGGEPFATKGNALRAFKAARVKMIQFGFYGIVRLGSTPRTKLPKAEVRR
jgi:uncharacterized protein YegP (UPF0339 family)